MNKSRVETLAEVAYLGSLIGKIHGIADGITDDDQYTNEDAISDLLKLATDILNHMAMKTF